MQVFFYYNSQKKRFFLISSLQIISFHGNYAYFSSTPPAYHSPFFQEDSDHRGSKKKRIFPAADAVCMQYIYYYRGNFD